MAKINVKCEDCGFEFQENGCYDLAQSILYHIKSGDCEEQQEKAKAELLA